MHSLKLAKIAALFAVALRPTIAPAASIEYATPDGTYAIRGDVTGFDGETLTVQTSAGEIRLPAADITCAGADCPDDLNPAIMIAASDTRTLSLAQDVLGLSTASSSRYLNAENTGASTPSFGLQTNVKIIPAALATDGTVIITDAISPETTSASGVIGDWLQTTSPSQLLTMKAFSVVVGPDVGVESLTESQIAQIFAGEIVNWSEVGGADTDIVLLLTDEGTRLHADIQSVVMQPARKPITPIFALMDDVNDIPAAVATTSGAISMLPSQATESLQTIGVANPCGMPSWPTEFAIRSGDYPLTLSTLVLYPSELDNTFLHAAFDQAAAHQTALRTQDGAENSALLHLPEPDKVGRFINLMSDELSDAEKTDAAALVELLIDADQLSITLTDGVLSQTQGAWARAHFVQLRDAILSGAFDGQEIMFLGFSSDMDTEIARAASLQAANRMMASFTAFAPEAANHDAVQFRASGHVTLGQSACVTHDETQHHVPKIEVWTHPIP